MRELSLDPPAFAGYCTKMSYDYVNDAAGRRTAITRSGSMMSETRTDAYGYNDRSELTNAVKNATLNEYAYQYDDIGNRLSSMDLESNRTYVANELNQYTNIVIGVDNFTPQFDLDGNQTLVKTSTGVWYVTYNGENRPVSWTCGATNIVMKFDSMGRRVEYIETVNGVTNTHHRFVYDGYLCIQRLNGANNNSIDLVFGWDPSERVATRPLILQKYGAYSLFYTHDGNKNVSDLVFFQQANGIAAHYEYAPFGAVTAVTRSTPVTAYDFREYNPFRFSSEYADDRLELVYYNYRHYNPQDGRWTSRDLMEKFKEIILYNYCLNNSIDSIDTLGLIVNDPPDVSFNLPLITEDCTVIEASSRVEPMNNYFKVLTQPTRVKIRVVAKTDSRSASALYEVAATGGYSDASFNLPLSSHNYWATHTEYNNIGIRNGTTARKEYKCVLKYTACCSSSLIKDEMVVETRYIDGLTTGAIDEEARRYGSTMMADIRSQTPPEFRFKNANFLPGITYETFKDDCRKKAEELTVVSHTSYQMIKRQ